MKMESCPQCGVVRECKVWRHCHCGHDFEPGYIYTRGTPVENEIPKPDKAEPDRLMTLKEKVLFWCAIVIVLVPFQVELHVGVTLWNFIFGK